ncbi:MAG TPA: hypothetical protein VMG38_08410 [Trebonia sp.]|nr:hypothetical protein [Trebonia sp.]
MLRLRDARTGELTDVLPSGRRQLRILVSAPGQLRAYLTADLLRRAAEQSGLLPEVSELLPTGVDTTRLRATCDDLNIHPPVATLTALSVEAGMQPFDVGLGLGDEALSAITGLARLWARVSRDNHEAQPGPEPLALRLSLMRLAYGERLWSHWTPTADAEALGHWRELVAQWARSASGAMSRPHADAITRAFAHDLDSPAAVTTLAELADDPDVADGVKFETFAAADRLFGLDLARDVGK